MSSYGIGKFYVFKKKKKFQHLKHLQNWWKTIESWYLLGEDIVNMA
jgi:hypothetical protein